MKCFTENFKCTYKINIFHIIKVIKGATYSKRTFNITKRRVPLKCKVAYTDMKLTEEHILKVSLHRCLVDSLRRNHKLNDDADTSVQHIPLSCKPKVQTCMDKNVIFVFIYGSYYDAPSSSVSSVQR